MAENEMMKTKQTVLKEYIHHDWHDDKPKQHNLI